MYKKKCVEHTKIITLTDNVFISIALIIITSLCFINSYNGEFVFDDSEAVVNNNDVKDTPLHEIFQNDFWGTNLSHKESHKSYRPLTILSFRLHYWWKENLNPKDFHLMNIILNIIVCILTFFVFQILLDWNEPQISFYGTLFFAVHPIHTEAVSGIVGRADILCCLFMWLTIILYNKCVYSKSFFISCISMLLCIINTAVAMFCKETGITVLGICFMYDIFIVYKISPLSLLKVIRLDYSFTDMKHFVETKLLLMVRCIVLFLSGLLLIWLRFSIMGYAKPTFQPIDNPASFLDNPILRLVNYNYIYWLNLWLLLCPNWLCFDWSMGCIPLILGMDSRICFIILLWSIIGGLLIIVFSEKDYEFTRCITMGLTVLILPFFPASNMFFTVGFVLAERTLYIPSAGYCIIVALGLKKLYMNIAHNRVVIISYCALLLIFFARSWMRSAQWKTETTLFQYGLNVCPLNAKVHYNVGKDAADRGMKDLAKIEYQEAIRLNPKYAQALNNLGNLYKDEAQYDKAEKLLRNAVALKKNFAAAWMNLGIVLSARKKYQEGERCYITAISYRPVYPDCYYNLGLLYLAKHNHEKALNAWKIATKQKSIHRRAWTNLILLLDDLDQKDQALEVANQALHYLPHDPSIHFNIGNILGKIGKFEESEYHLMKAIDKHPQNPTYYTNLGVLYHRWNKYEKAEIMYKKASRLNPHSNIIKENLNKLKNLKLKRSNKN